MGPLISQRVAEAERKVTCPANAGWPPRSWDRVLGLLTCSHSQWVPAWSEAGRAHAEGPGQR